MITTPAWPPQSAPRLFVETPLTQGADIRVDGGQAHYLISVMRLKIGGCVRLFDDVSGEWLAQANHIGKRELILSVTQRLSARESVPDLWLAAAPIRKARYDWVAEKACELGVARFAPVLMQRCVADKVKEDRLRAHMIEAAEQCGRTALPIVAAPLKLEAFLTDFPEERALFFADEDGGAPFTELVHRNPGPAAILIGPEGGFADHEREMVRAHPAAMPVSLGPRILRADSAAIAAVSVWMSVAGDWGRAI
ncbi:MAG: 16S rRNA (uracil(1498)-N(3))-methyltransferase [Pseudomonadota bacterium]